MICRVCSSPDTRPLWKDSDGFQWHRCVTCGSDTSEAVYEPDRYGREYITTLLGEEGNDPPANHEHNADLFPEGKPGRTFLDVGTGHGASQDVMRRRGWATIGWDVSAAGRPPGTIVSESFRADLFARPFDAVLAREVLEHVQHPCVLLQELRAATAPDGILQLTTPRPIDRGDEWRVYQWSHLAVWSPESLVPALQEAGFEVIQSILWELGQRHVCRAFPTC